MQQGQQDNSVSIDAHTLFIRGVVQNDGDVKAGDYTSWGAVARVYNSYTSLFDEEAVCSGSEHELDYPKLCWFITND